MKKEGTPGTAIELQATSDLFFTVIEVYTIKDLELPTKIIRPEQLLHMDINACKNKIQLYCDSTNHFSAIVKIPQIVRPPNKF